MSEYSLIRFKRTRNSVDPADQVLMNSDYPVVTDVNNHITNSSVSVCEPWVQTYQKQIWVDNVCLNSHLYVNTLPSGSSSLLTLDNVFVNGEMKSNLSFDYGSLLTSLELDVNPFVIAKGSNTYAVYNPFATTGTALVLGDHLDFNSITSKLDSEYIDDITIASGADLSNNNVSNFENFDTSNVLSSHKYLWVSSTFGKNHLCDITSLFRPNYDSNTLTLNVSTDTLSLSEVNVTADTSTPSALVHEGTFNAITSLSVDNYGRVIGYTNTTYTLPEGGDSGGTAVNQTLTATLGSQIVGTDPAESHFAVLRLSGDNTPIMLKGISSDGNGNGTDIRMSVTNSSSEDTVIIKIHCIDGGLIQ